MPTRLLRAPCAAALLLAGLAAPSPVGATVVENRLVAATTPESIALGTQVAPGTVVSHPSLGPITIATPFAQRFVLQARAVPQSGADPSRGVARWIGVISLDDAAPEGTSALGVPGTTANRVLPPMNSGFALQGSLSPDGRLISGIRAVYPFFQTTVWQWDTANQVPLTPVPQLIGVAPEWTDVKEFTLSVTGNAERLITIAADLDGPASAVADPYRFNQSPPEVPEEGSEPQTVSWIADPSAPAADVNAVAVFSIGSPCSADFNGVDGVTVQDVYDFLAAWNAGLPGADFNGLDGVTVQDIYDFLAAWNAGC